MAAKYPKHGDGNMTTRNFLLDGSPIYFSLSESEQLEQLFASGAKRSRCQPKRSGIEQ
jgi:hypothetical protein